MTVIIIRTKMNCVSESWFLVLWNNDLRIRIEATNTKVLIFLETMSSLEFPCVAKFSVIQEYWLLSAYNEDKLLEESCCGMRAKNKNSRATSDFL